MFIITNQNSMSKADRCNLPSWLSLKCYEKLVWNPASLFSQAVATILTNKTIDGYTQLEEIAHLQFAPRQKSEPIYIIYKNNCNILGCFAGEVSNCSYHHHIERLGHYKFWNKNCRISRKCIDGALPLHQETTILNEIHECKRARRISETKQLSCKRKLFE